jgi:hypothetical protein
MAEYTVLQENNNKQPIITYENHNPINNNNNNIVNNPPVGIPLADAIYANNTNPIPSQINAYQQYNLGNRCYICGSIAVDKCIYGRRQGRPCNRPLCLEHRAILPDFNGNPWPHCSEHYELIKGNALCDCEKCVIL